MINDTNDRIRYVSFKYFLEKGYEATNIRDICNEVGIKASSLYFYYKSKEELFFSIYDEISSERNRCFNETGDLDYISPDMRLYCIYKRIMNYTAEDIVKQRFLLRYLLFPTEEITKLLREKYQYWKDKENIVILNLIKQCMENDILSVNNNPNDYLHKYNKFISVQTIETIISNIKTSYLEQDLEWTKFWNSIMIRGI